MKRLLLFLIAGLAVGSVAGRNADADNPASPSNERASLTQTKNVVLIVSDDLRADVLGCYGDSLARTPHLDRLARQSMVFDSAYCQATWCAPSRQSFMHGRYFDDAAKTMGETFQSAGMSSVRVGKIFHMRVPGDIIAGTDGEDVAACWSERFNSSGAEAHTPGEYACWNQNIITRKMKGRQSTKMPHRAYVTVKIDGDGSDQPDAKSADRATRWLRENGGDGNPFFLAVGLIRPHYPMVAPRELFDHYPPESMAVPQVPTGDLEDIPEAGLALSRSSTNGMDRYPQNAASMWSGYRASVEFMDTQVGRILDEIDALGLAEDTMVIFTSDHGYHLGEHTFWQKSNLHEDVARVPLIVRSPSMPPARRTSCLVELVDLYPTICQSLAIDIPATCQGTSLIPVLLDPTQRVKDAAHLVHRKGRQTGYLRRTLRWAYMRYDDGSQELYDMNADPEQLNNLAVSAEPRFRSTITQLDRDLDQWLAASE